MEKDYRVFNQGLTDNPWCLARIKYQLKNYKT